MTIKEALQNRIPRVRLPVWNEKAYLRLPLTENNMFGPWAELYDRYGQEALGYGVGTQKIAIHTMFEDDGYEVYEGEPDESEKNNYSKIYSES